MIRLDCGTENVKVAAVQYAFRENHGDVLSGENSVRFGTSPSNIVHNYIIGNVALAHVLCTLEN